MMTNQVEETAPKSYAFDIGTHDKPKDGTSGRGWHGDPKGHAEAGSAGGQKVAEDRTHMSQIGKKGGQSVSKNRQHMAEIGRKGGLARTNAASNEPNKLESDENIQKQ